MKNNVGVTRIVTYNCRKMAICCFLLLCIKVSWRHLANLKQMLRICALLALGGTIARRILEHTEKLNAWDDDFHMKK